MKKIGNMNEKELGAYVSTFLRKRDIEVVLSGGACVSIYTDNEYVSMDIDLINMKFAKRNRIREAMNELGFREQGRYFVHSETKYMIEFPPGPLAVGDENVKQIIEIKVSTGTLKLLSPTDCVKDRLAWYYHHNDFQCLEQAAMVAKNHVVDLKEIRRWSNNEGKLEEFKRVRRKLTCTK